MLYPMLVRIQCLTHIIIGKVNLYYLIISTPTQHVKDTSITNENISLCRLTQRACIRQPPNI